MKQYKQLPVLFAVFVLFSLVNCHKNLTDRSGLSADQALIENARAYFQKNLAITGSAPTGNPRLDGTRNRDWGSAFCVSRN